MGAAKPCLGYQSRTEAVQALRREGLLTREIADRIGIDSKTVSALEASAVSPRPARPDRIDVQHSIDVQRRRSIAELFPYHQKEILRDHAAKRQLTVEQLIQRIVETVIADELIDAVLDDRDRKRERQR